MIYIYSQFENLNDKKQKKILNAALKEFASNGFEKASTNVIVKEAGISKGSLFNYFNSKKDLYIYLFYYSINIVEQMYERIDLKEKDLFKRISNFGVEKLKIQKENPYVFEFLAAAMIEESRELEVIIGERVELIYDKGLGALYQDIDYSKFKNNIDVEKAIEILNWTIFGFGEKIIEQLTSYKDINEFAERVFKEWEVYSNLLRQSFYK